jgi:hypothetical protein
METASWDKDIGQLKLSVRPTATMRFGVRYVFVIFLTNPDAAMTAKDVTISIESGTVPIAPSFMSRPLDRERQVLFVSAPKFNLALAAQRHPFPGSLNGIQVRFITNIDLVGPKTSDGAGDCILISGLLNTLPRVQGEEPDGVQMQIVDDPPWSSVKPGSSSLESGFEDAISGYGIWSRSKGTLLLTLGKEKSIVSGRPYTFHFELRNPAVENNPTPDTIVGPKRDSADTGLYVTANRTIIVTSTIPGTVAPELTRTTFVMIQKTLITRDDVAARSNLAALIDSMGATGECAIPLDVIPSASFVTCPSERSSECCPSYR